jgi:hypothetical protein
MGAIDGELYGEITKVGASAVNQLAEDVFYASQVEVPKAQGEKAERDIERHGETLAQSGRYGGGRGGPRGGTSVIARSRHVDLDLRATPEKLEAQVVYESDYALAQHEGVMEYERGGKAITWAAHNYSTPGTKSHYLSDPLKALAGNLPYIAGEMMQGVCADFTAAGEAALLEFERTGKMP